MRAAYITPGQGIASLKFEDEAIPTPGPDEAVVRIRAATVNYRDLIYADGRMPTAKQPAYVPLAAAAGEVVAIGAGVDRVAPGDRVSPVCAPSWISGAAPPDYAMLGGPIDGVAREHAAFPADALVHIPNAVDDMAAATLPCTGLTAWHALFAPRPLKAGDWVLVQGTGGVAITALQLAKAAGARVIVTSSSDAKLDRARMLGADVGINYRSTPDWSAAARASTDGRGVDIVLDLAGAETIRACAEATKEDGLIARIGQLAGSLGWDQDVDRPNTNIVVGNRAQHEALLAFVATNGIQPFVDGIFDMADLGCALRHLASGAHFGHIAIRLQ